jgi:cytochrome c oxidase subunit IV
MTDAAHAAAAGAEHHETNYMAKFWWLLGLTIIEVLIAWKVPSPALRGIGLAVFACWKAAIVLQHFMHLKNEGIALKLAMLFPLCLIAILVLLFLTDSYFLGYSGM